MTLKKANWVDDNRQHRHREGEGGREEGSSLVQVCKMLSLSNSFFLIVTIFVFRRIGSLKRGSDYREFGLIEFGPSKDQRRNLVRNIGQDRCWAQIVWSQGYTAALKPPELLTHSLVPHLVITYDDVSRTTTANERDWDRSSWEFCRAR